MNCPRCGAKLSSLQCSCGFRVDSDEITLMNPMPLNVQLSLQSFISEQYNTHRLETERQKRLEAEARQQDEMRVQEKQKQTEEARLLRQETAEEEKYLGETEKTAQLRRDARITEQIQRETAQRQKEIEDENRKQRKAEEAARNQREAEQIEIKIRQEQEEKAKKQENEFIEKLPVQIQIYPNAKRPLQLLDDWYLKYVQLVDRIILILLPITIVAYSAAFYYLHLQTITGKSNSAADVIFYIVAEVLAYALLWVNSFGHSSILTWNSTPHYIINVGGRMPAWVFVFSLIMKATIVAFLFWKTPNTLLDTNYNIIIVALAFIMTNFVIFYVTMIISEYILERLLVRPRAWKSQF